MGPLIGIVACILRLLLVLTKRYSCNTASTEGKQGGTMQVECLVYDFNPNSRYFPDCQMEESKSVDTRDESTAEAAEAPALNCHNKCYGMPLSLASRPRDH